MSEEAPARLPENRWMDVQADVQEPQQQLEALKLSVIFVLLAHAGNTSERSLRCSKRATKHLLCPGLLSRVVVVEAQWVRSEPSRVVRGSRRSHTDVVQGATSQVSP
jgi:hypothetical protein